MPARIIVFLNNSRAADARKLLRGRCKQFVSKLLSNTSFVKVVGRQFFRKLGGRTIGSTSDSGSDYPGSSPGLPANLRNYVT
jgi:hypothetical protein